MNDFAGLSPISLWVRCEVVFLCFFSAHSIVAPQTTSIFFFLQDFKQCSQKLSLILQGYDINQFPVKLCFMSEHAGFTLPGSCSNCPAKCSKSVPLGAVTLQYSFHSSEISQWLDILNSDGQILIFSVFLTCLLKEIRYMWKHCSTSIRTPSFPNNF